MQLLQINRHTDRTPIIVPNNSATTEVNIINRKIHKSRTSWTIVKFNGLQRSV
jgi:hypothetical protein